MAKKMTIEEAYRAYFYENGEHLKGVTCVEAYKAFILDAYRGDFVLLDDNGNSVRPEKEKTAENLRHFQGKLDNMIYDHVHYMEGEEKEKALASEVIACTVADYNKLKCARMNAEEIFENAGGNLTKYQKLTLRLANVFATTEPSKSSQGVVNCAEGLRSVAKDIRSHKPGFFTYLFRRGTYNTRMAEYEELKLRLSCAIHTYFYPIHREQYLSGKEFAFLHLGEGSPVSSPELTYNSLMHDARELLPKTDFKSVFYQKEVDEFREKNKRLFDDLAKDPRLPAPEDDRSEMTVDEREIEDVNIPQEDTPEEQKKPETEINLEGDVPSIS